MLEKKQNVELLLIKDLGPLYPTKTSKKKTRFGLYKCSCGNEFKAIANNVNHGKTLSCGCLKKISNTTHGLYGHPVYIAWHSMRQRCFNNKYIGFKDYGGRGITICERWLKFENFIEDMLPTYIKGLSIDRIDANGNYEPTNCRWATPTIQARNTRLLRDNNTSGYRGVSYHKRSKKFMAYINVDKKQFHLGTFENAVCGAIAYNNFIIENKLEHPLNII